MTYAHPDSIVSTEWLARHLSEPGRKILDASWCHPSTGRKGRDEYLASHIPGAVYFDIDDIADKSRTLPHMLPDSATFAAGAGSLGIGDGDHVVVYDRSGGGAAAARVWWTFRLFGHARISVLDGGFTKWQREARPTDGLIPAPVPARLSAAADLSLVRDKSQMLANIASGREQVIDARPHDRFAGKGPEPWPHIKVGHIPGSLNLPWSELLDPASGTFLPADAMAAKFAEAGLTAGCPVVATCGSGVTASMLALGLHLTGHGAFAVYDGSWAEWGLDADTPIEAG